ncbi:MerR family transcriptional regulator [Megasphaera elsdenii]|uniref:MerR family transcriptional regulator n=1 Tax=Megasphaera elsdenii TaxID=907 RepID=UPI00242BD61C|nr:MerR family transcriptional regulator [Megasphaera elsdenii]
MKKTAKIDSKAKFMTIKDVSERTDLSVYTLRYYAREGLLPSVERDNNGVRTFTEADLESVYIIECLKNCNMSIQEIKDFTRWTMEGDATIDKRLALFQEKYNVMQKKMWKMQETLEALQYKVWFYHMAKQAGTVAVHDSMKPEDVPEKMCQIRDRMKHVERLTKERKFWDKVRKQRDTQEK